MNRCSNVIKMLLFLKSHGLVKKSQIAEFLDVNERNISEYRKELVNAGYDIEVVPGKEGGYLLNSQKLFPVMQFTPDETQAMVLANRYLEHDLGFTMRESFKNAVIKMLHLEPHKKMIDYTMVEGVQYNVDTKLIENWFYIINNSITSKVKLKIKYYTSRGEEKEKTVHPYDVFRYRSMWYLVSKSDNSDNIFTLKFNRITSIKQVNERFTVVKEFDPSDFVTEFGININQEVDIELKLFNDAKYYAKEYIYGANQVITEYEDHLELKCTLSSLYIAKHMVLTFGKDCVVVKPLELRDLIIEEAKKMTSNYED